MMRSGIVMGEGGGALRRQLPLFRFGVGGPLSTGKLWLSPISLVDEVKAILWIVDRKVSAPVNLTRPSPITNSQFTRESARALRRLAVMKVPALALKVALGSQMTRDAVLASQRVVPLVLSREGLVFNNPDVHAIISEVVRPRIN